MDKIKTPVEDKRGGMPPEMARGVKNPLWWDVATRMQQAREIAGVTMQEVERRSGVTTGTLSTVERDHHTPRIDTVERIAAALGVSPCWVAFGEDGGAPFVPRIKRNGNDPHLPKPRGPLKFEARHAGCGERVQKRRMALGIISVRKLGRRSGVSHQTIANIEKGLQVPKLDSLHRLAVALDVAPCWLAFGIGRKPGKVKRDLESTKVKLVAPDQEPPEA